MKKFLTALTILMAQNCFAQTEIEKREPFTLRLPVDGVNYYEQQVAGTPYFVKEKTLQIYPGEKLFIEVEIKKDTIFSMRVVKEKLSPEKTIEIDFSQSVKENKSEMMMLKVTNPFGKVLEYKAIMYIVGQDNWINTTISPVQPKLTGYETWPDVIITLVLDKWKLK